MSITPVDGWGGPPKQRAVFTQDDALSEGQVLTNTSDVCPSCYSNDWRSASLVYSEGLSVRSSRTSGITVGIARTGLRNGQFSIGGGSYSGRTLGKSQTLLSSMASPPRKRNGLKVFLTLILLSFSGSAINSFQTEDLEKAVACSIAAIVLLLVLINVWTRQRRAYDDALAEYENMRICQRCGTFYTA
jgi:hypothetical protein